MPLRPGTDNSALPNDLAVRGQRIDHSVGDRDGPELSALAENHDIPATARLMPDWSDPLVLCALLSVPLNLRQA